MPTPRTYRSVEEIAALRDRVKELHAQGLTIKQIATRTGVSVSHTHNLVHGRGSRTGVLKPETYKPKQDYLKEAKSLPQDILRKIQLGYTLSPAEEERADVAMREAMASIPNKEPPG